MITELDFVRTLGQDCLGIGPDSGKFEIIDRTKRGLSLGNKSFVCMYIGLR